MDEIIFDVKNVTKIFGETEETKVNALKNVKLEIHRGEFTAFVGPSGSGKSTLLNVMSGFDTPSSGHVFLSNKEIDKMSGNELSNFRIPVLTVKENVEYVMTLQNIDKDERDRKVSQYLKSVGLEGKENRYPSQLSGGQQQRVAVARAMVSNPDIVIADEPTANLDSKTGTDLIDMMLELNEKFGTTFIFSTHDPIIMKKAKRLITLKDGQIVSDETK